MNNNEWLDIDVLEDYLDGKLDARTMHRVERLSLEDPFVTEALAGLSASPKRVQSLSLLQKQLQERIAQKPVEAKRWQITSHRLSIAAAAAVLFITVSVLFWMRESSNREKIAANAPKKVEVAIAANKMPEKPVAKPKDEVEKVIAAAKNSTYASRSKRATTNAQKSVIAPVAPTSSSDVREVAAEGLSLRAIDLKEINEVKSKQVAPSALSGKVARLPIKNTINEDKQPNLVALAISASPVGGWDKFETYILNNNQLLVDKKLTGRAIALRFKINNVGEPIDIQVDKISSLNPTQTKKEEDEAMRLLKNGPKWNNPASSVEAVVLIKF